MDNLTPVRSFLQDLITPIVTAAVKAAIPAVEPQEEKDYISVKQAIERYTISCSTIYRRFEEGTLTKVKSGGRTLIKVSEIEGSLEERPLCAVEPCRRGRKGK